MPDRLLVTGIIVFHLDRKIRVVLMLIYKVWIVGKLTIIDSSLIIPKPLGQM